MRKLRIIFIDGDELTRTLFSYIFEDPGGIEMVGEASEHQSAMALIRRFKPDAVIIGYDLSPHEDSRLRACLRAEFPQMRVIDLSELDQAVSKKLSGQASMELGYSTMVH